MSHSHLLFQLRDCRHVRLQYSRRISKVSADTEFIVTIPTQAMRAEPTYPVSNMERRTVEAFSSAMRLSANEIAAWSSSQSNPNSAGAALMRGRPLERRDPRPITSFPTSGSAAHADVPMASLPTPISPCTLHHENRSRSRSSSAFSYSRPIRSTNNSRELVNADSVSPKRRRSPSNCSWRGSPGKNTSQHWSPPSDRRQRSWSRGSRGSSRSPSPQRYHRLPRRPSPSFCEPFSPYPGPTGDHWQSGSRSPHRDPPFRALSTVYPQRTSLYMPPPSDHWEPPPPHEPDGPRKRQPRRKLTKAQKRARANAAALAQP